MTFHSVVGGATLIAVAGLLAAGTTPAAGSAPYQSARGDGGCSPSAQRLPDLGYGGEVLGFRGNEAVGGVVNAHGKYQPAIWRNGNLTVLTRFRLGEALDINGSGEIVGGADKQRIAWVKMPGSGIIRLRNTDGSSGPFSIYARRVSSNGKIAGAVDGEQYGARWDSADADPTVLPPATGDTYSLARGIDDAGYAAGETDDANFVPRGAVWDPAGTIHVYDSAFGAGKPSILYVINDAQVSAGESFKVDDQGNILADVATLWSPTGQPQPLGHLPHDNQSTALGLSQGGYVSGESSGMDYATGEQTRPVHAFVWSGSGPLLPLPVPGMSYRHSESVAHVIGDNGEAGGFAGPVNGPIYPYLWTCVFGQGFRPSAAAAASEPRPGAKAWRPLAFAPDGRGFARRTR